MAYLYAQVDEVTHDIGYQGEVRSVHVVLSGPHYDISDDSPVSRHATEDIHLQLRSPDDLGAPLRLGQVFRVTFEPLSDEEVEQIRQRFQARVAAWEAAEQMREASHA